MAKFNPYWRNEKCEVEGCERLASTKKYCDSSNPLWDGKSILCIGHADEKGFISDEEKMRVAENRRIGREKAKETRRKNKENKENNKNEHVSDKEVGGVKPTTSNNTKNSREYLTYETIEVFHPHNFDLEAEYEENKSIGLDQSDTDYDKKRSYSAWYHAEKKTRKPKTRDGAAEILGVTPKTLRLWEKSTVLTLVRKEMLDMIMRNGAGYEAFIMNLFQGLRQGKDKASDIYRHMFGEKEPPKSPQKSNLTKEKMSKVDKIIKDRTNQPEVPNDLGLKGMAKKIADKGTAEKFFDIDEGESVN